MAVGLRFIDVSSESWYDIDDHVAEGGVGEMSGVVEVEVEDEEPVDENSGEEEAIQLLPHVYGDLLPGVILAVGFALIWSSEGSHSSIRNKEPNVKRQTIMTLGQNSEDRHT